MFVQDLSLGANVITKIFDDVIAREKKRWKRVEDHFHNEKSIHLALIELLQNASQFFSVIKTSAVKVTGEHDEALQHA